MSAPPTSLIRLSYYPSVAINRLMCALRLWNQWDWVDPFLLLGAVPARRHIRRLADLGVTAIVNMCKEFPGHLDEMDACRMDHFHLPTLDYHCPNADLLLRGVRFIQERAARGLKTFLHCKAGQGRSATLAVCYLMADRGISAAEAFAAVKAVRPHIVRNLHARAPVLEVERRLRGATVSLDNSQAL